MSQPPLTRPLCCIQSQIHHPFLAPLSHCFQLSPPFLGYELGKPKQLQNVGVTVLSHSPMEMQVTYSLAQQHPNTVLSGADAG